MIDIVTETMFIDTFKKIRPNNFSYDGLKVLFEHLEEYENSTGEEIEFDVIAICCDYSEYETKKELLNDYSSFETFEEIEEQTEIIEFKKWDIKTLSNNDYSSYIIRAF